MSLLKSFFLFLFFKRPSVLYGKELAFLNSHHSHSLSPLPCLPVLSSTQDPDQAIWKEEDAWDLIS